jgi:hypothetical protein
MDEINKIWTPKKKDQSANRHKHQSFQNKTAAAGAPAGATRFTAGYFV